jgi:hypothetical protein
MLIPFLRLIYIILQREKVIKKSHNSKNQGFSSFFLVDGRIWIRQAQKHTDPTDPGPAP